MPRKSQFSEEFLRKIQKFLEEEKLRLEKELRKFTKKNPHVEDDYDAAYPEYGDKEDENAMEVAQYTTNRPLEIALENELRDVKKAIERLEKGAYGICKYCKQPIDEKRLLARPTSGACISCKKTLTNEI
ncbi:MAG TPA: TraR/DksA C4-type zinc finger protein [Patescibacteria group bacterium]|nr:TraR/DksA C4-type zinc finger protein [Patescibacteria group bacterium]